MNAYILTWDGFKKNAAALLALLVALALFIASSVAIFTLKDAESPVAIKVLPQRQPAPEMSPLAELETLTSFFRPQDLLAHASDLSQEPNDSKELFNAPISSINVRVAGVVTASQQRHAMAIVQQGQKQHSLFVGDSLPGTQAKIVHIFPDRVILYRSGKYESLRMLH